MTEAEKTVVLKNDMDNSQAGAALAVQGGTDLSALKKSIPQFQKVEFDTFKAEYSLDGKNIVVHFFLPQRKVTEHYWKHLFAQVLNDVGQGHFQATMPRLVAKYTAELHSWWFKAQGYDHILDVESFMATFFEKMNAGLVHALQTQSSAS